MNNASLQAKERLHAAITSRSLLRKESIDIRSPNGNSNDFLFDFRAILLDPNILADLAEIFWSPRDPAIAVQIGGPESASIPLVTALVIEGARRGFNVTGFYIRKSRKRHGVMKQIEGTLTEHPVILIDDLVNSGGTLEKYKTLLTKEGCNVTELFGILRFLPRSAYVFLETGGTAFSTLFSLQDFGIPSAVPPQLPYFFTQKWYFKSKEANRFFLLPKPPPVLAHNNIYIGSDNGYLWCLSPKDGSVTWQFRTGLRPRGAHILSTPLITDNSLYAASYNGNVFSLDAVTGKLHWIFSEGDWISSSPTFMKKNNSIAISLRFGMFTKRGIIVSLDCTTGKKIWHYETNGIGSGNSVYDFKNDTLYTSNKGNSLIALSGRTGKKQWQVDIEGISEARPYFDATTKRIAVGTEGDVRILSTDTGSEIFQCSIGAPVRGEIIGHDGKILFGSLDKRVYCFDILTGLKIWEYETAGRIFSSPTYMDEGILIGSNDGKLHLLDIHNGKLLGSFQTAERIVSCPAIDPITGMLYVATFDNEVYALTLSKRV